MVSKRAKYAFKALRKLAEQYGRGPVMISWLSEQESIPKRFLESILLDLRNHGLLQSQKGKGGGYMLRLEPERINLAQVLRIIDGPIAPTPCVSKNFYVRCDDCEDEETCTIRPIMLQVRDANLSVYENITLRELQTIRSDLAHVEDQPN
ncbi:Rrf2 family transcriptional regulator [Rudanella paleaurantiibacter]|uniref:Rrf2 family transcriptional regulator n=1 Tax=Rudanella paleaurantiibacter TaxID=2614655 RepID=A0A7J5TYE7_9BACT|nr:Rrf2 family transcriptional regulator [Rudanella paleaurantiibacter]KAB7730085.1 Rrf2 family transcriptional regulator [Rudanella paleaurantiibacter]